MDNDPTTTPAPTTSSDRPLLLDSLERRMRTMHGLYYQAVGSMGLEHVNHFEREGVLPIAFSLFHYTNMEDVCFAVITGTAPLWGAEWQARVGMTIDDHGKHRTVDEMVHQRIGDYDAFCAYQREVFDRTEAWIATVELDEMERLLIPRPFPPAVASTYSARVAGEAGITVLDATECWLYQHGLRHMGEIELARGLVGLGGMNLVTAGVRVRAAVAVATVVASACGGGSTDENRPSPTPTTRPDNTTEATTTPTTRSTTTEAPPKSLSAGTTDPPGTNSESASTTANPGPAGAAGAAAAVGETVAGAEAARRRGFPELTGKRVGLLGHAASVVGDERTGPIHLVDALMADSDVTLVSLFSPEHGFRSDAGAGVGIGSEVDTGTGLPIYSLYGDTKAPTPAMLAGIDVLAVDLQDVGARYYTYISTLGLAMQAAARAGIEVVVYDRPNPQGRQAASGPMRDAEHESFVGQYPVPALYAMTIGELATAVKGEGWLDGTDGLQLEVIDMAGYSHDQRWIDTRLPWNPPSPGLQTPDAALLYPALIWLEPTVFSFGSGTTNPFTSIAAPWLDGGSLAQSINEKQIPGLSAGPTSFVPVAIEGMNQDPKYEDQMVHGATLTITDYAVFDPWTAGVALLELLRPIADGAGHPLIEDPEMFDLLAGSTELRQWIESSEPADSFIASVAAEIEPFAQVRSRYLRYP